MQHVTRRAGTACLRWLVLASALVGLCGSATLLAQEKAERPKSEENSKFETFRTGGAYVVVEGNKDATAQNRQLLDKMAKWFVYRLNDAQIQKDGMAQLVQDLDKKLLLTPYDRLKLEQRQFVEEFGKSLITLLENPALNSGKPIVRVNAARMAAEVARSGYSGAAELFLKILAKEKETDGVKLWAIHGLHNLFAIVPDLAKEKTIFQKKDDANLTPLERKSIQALISFIERKIQVSEGAGATDEEATWYVRREAIRALGHVRVQAVKNLGQVESRPALELLKVARRDIPSPADPTRNVAERIEGIIGFCQLFPGRDRDLQLDYAAYHIGMALYEIVDYRINHLTDMSIPWKATGGRLREALDTWRDREEKNRSQDAKLVKELWDIAERDILSQLEAGQQGVVPNGQGLAAWLTNAKPQSTSLFKSDGTTVINTK